jgi:hypothetical protein
MVAGALTAAASSWTSSSSWPLSRRGLGGGQRARIATQRVRPSLARPPSASSSSGASGSSEPSSSSSSAPGEPAVAVEPPERRRAARSRQAELLDRELAAVRALGLDADGLRAALRALGEKEEAEEEAGQAEENEAAGTENNPSSSISLPALQRRLAARRLRERARVVKLPIRYTSSGKRAASRRFLTVPVDVDGVGFTDFLLDAGVYGAAITPALRDRLGLAPTDGSAVTALASGGATVRQKVALPEMWIGTQRLPPLHATVGPLPSAARPSSSPAPPPSSSSTGARPGSPPSSLSSLSSLATAAAAAAAAASSAAAEPPGGLLGVKALRAFDLDFDPRAGALGLHPAGHAAAGLLDVKGLRAVACRFTRAGLVCLPVALGLAAGGGGEGGADNEPLPPPAVLGILDLSAAVSVLNWQAAALLGMRCEAALRERAEEEQEEREEREGGGGAATGAPQQQQQPRPLDYRGHYGQIVFSDAPPLLERPRPPPSLAPKPPPTTARSSSSNSGRVRSTQLELQEHRVAVARARWALGDARVGGGRVRVRPPPRVAVAHLKGLAQLGLQPEQPAMLVGADVWAARRAVLCLKEGLLYLE